MSKFTMGRKSLVLKFFLCLVLLTVILWLLDVKYLFSQNNASVRSNQTEKSTVIGSHVEPNQTKPWLLVYWSTLWGKQVDLQLAWKKRDCPVACEVTSNRSRAGEANGFIVHAYDSHVIPLIESVPWILLTQENPYIASALSEPSFMSKFQLLVSYRLDSDIPLPVYPMPKLTPPLPFKDKEGLIFAAFSHCEPVRTEYMKQLMNFVPVDSFGACLKNKEGLLKRGYSSADGKHFKQHKTELARKYKFTLVFFNQDCDYFVDDQLIHALDAGSIPVVMATDKLDEFLPGNLRHSVIKARDFKNPQKLAEYLKFLNTNEKEYNKYLEWKRKGIGNITGTVIGDYWNSKYSWYCQVCVALAEGKIHKDGLQPIICKKRSFEDWGIERQPSMRLV